MADIDVLKDKEYARQISKDYSGMTNTILALSPFYVDHEIQKESKSYFHSLLR